MRSQYAEADVSIGLDVVTDGVAAIDYLFSRGEYADATTPAFVLPDYDLPKRNGAEVLAAVESNDILRRVPITIFTTFGPKDNVARMYDPHANAYATKPETVDQFVSIIDHLESSWLSTVTLPPVSHHEN